MSRDSSFCGRVVRIFTMINSFSPRRARMPQVGGFCQKIVADSMPLPSGGDGGR